MQTPWADKITAKCTEGSVFDGLLCWVYTGGRTPAGYGVSYQNGQQVYCHRAMYEALRADIPPGLSLDHLCRVRECCNPWHLEPVTHAENMRRAGAARQATPAFPCGHNRRQHRRPNRNDCAECHRTRERGRRK